MQARTAEDSARATASPALNAALFGSAIAGASAGTPVTGENQPRQQRPSATPAAPNFRPPHRDQYILQSPFRSRTGGSAADSNVFPRQIRRFSAARLWNPTNSTPRAPSDATQVTRHRRLSTPPPPAVPLSHPALHASSGNPTASIGVGSSDYPLLTLSEQRQSRHSISTRASLQVDRSGTSEQRVSLPKSVRRSVDDKSPVTGNTAVADSAVAGPSAGADWVGFEAHQHDYKELDKKPRVTGLRRRGQSIEQKSPAGYISAQAKSLTKVDKGKSKVAMAPSMDEPKSRQHSRDLERGPDVMGAQAHPRDSVASMPPGIGSAISSSNSSIMGDPDQQGADAAGEEWGPQHPCYPHLNPHVPTDSPEYVSTRIIRVRRDWLLEGDLAPTFSNLYPEILDPAGLSEQEFRRVIEKLNGELVPTFSPYSVRNILDGIMGVATGWLWEDFGFTSAKSRLRRLERWIERWNVEMAKNIGHRDSITAPRIVPLRRTGYMTVSQNYRESCPVGDAW
jgi:hypothetical protein